VKRGGRGLSQSPAYARARGVFGVLFIALGLLIVGQIVIGVVHKTGFSTTSLVAVIPGTLLGLAMIALGYVRIRGALAAGKNPVQEQPAQRLPERR
jgi:hypothetical protein